MLPLLTPCTTPAARARVGGPPGCSDPVSPQAAQGKDACSMAVPGGAEWVSGGLIMAQRFPI